MTPKEKAEELVRKNFLKLQIKMGKDRYDEAKQCALIAVQEILQSEKTAYPHQYIEVGAVFEQYWNEVKTEIEKL